MNDTTKYVLLGGAAIVAFIFVYPKLFPAQDTSTTLPSSGGYLPAQSPSFNLSIPSGGDPLSLGSSATTGSSLTQTAGDSAIDQLLAAISSKDATTANIASQQINAVNYQTQQLAAIAKQDIATNAQIAANNNSSGLIATAVNSIQNLFTSAINEVGALPDRISGSLSATPQGLAFDVLKLSNTSTNAVALSGTDENGVAYGILPTGNPIILPSYSGALTPVPNQQSISIATNSAVLGSQQSTGVSTSSDAAKSFGMDELPILIGASSYDPMGLAGTYNPPVAQNTLFGSGALAFLAPKSTPIPTISAAIYNAAPIIPATQSITVGTASSYNYNPEPYQLPENPRQLADYAPSDYDNAITNSGITRYFKNGILIATTSE